MYDYGITYDDLVNIPGVEPLAVGQNTRVSIDDLLTWRDEGCAYLETVLQKSGITPSATMDPAAHDRLKNLVKYFVYVRSLETLSVAGPIYDQMKARWDEGYREISARPQQLGNAQPSRRWVKKHVSSWDYTGFTKGNW